MFKFKTPISSAPDTNLGYHGINLVTMFIFIVGAVIAFYAIRYFIKKYGSTENQ